MNSDVLYWWEYFMTVVVVVILGVFAVLEGHLKARHHGEDEPLDLKEGVPPAGTERAKGHHRVLDLISPVVVEL